LKEDLHAYQSKYRELEELNIQIEKENEKLVDANAEMRETVVGLGDQVSILEAKLQEVGCQLSYAIKNQEMTTKNMA